MTSLDRSFDLPDVDSFTAGTVGPAGQRTFFLQAVAGPQIVTLKVEKQQVAALADYLADWPDAERKRHLVRIWLRDHGRRTYHG